MPNHGDRPDGDENNRPPAEDGSSGPSTEEGYNEDGTDKSLAGKSTQELIREIRARGKGRLAVPRPPPPPPPTNNPLLRELLDAGGEIIYEKFSHWLVKHACGTKLTKFDARGIRLSEVEAMRFVAAHTTIPVPHVHDVGENHFTMDFIPGSTLKEAWSDGTTTLSAQDKTLIKRQLRDYITQLRTFKSPSGTICSFGNRPAADSRQMYIAHGGPFADEAAYNEFLLSDLTGHSSVRDMIRTQMRTDHEIVLTHGDLHAINIIVRPGEGVVGIIDWELAGYYPEYVELMKPFRPATWECGYYRELLDVFPGRYDKEWVVDMVLTQWSLH